MDEEIIIFVALFAMIFGIYFLRSRENLAMIEKGMNPRRNHEVGPRPYAYMKYALLFIGAGLGLFIAYMIDITYLRDIMMIQQPDGTVYYRSSEEIYFSLLAVGGGIGMFIAYIMEKKHLAKMKADTPDKI